MAHGPTEIKLRVIFEFMSMVARFGLDILVHLFLILDHIMYLHDELLSFMLDHEVMDMELMLLSLMFLFNNRQKINSLVQASLQQVRITIVFICSIFSTSYAFTLKVLFGSSPQPA